MNDLPALITSITALVTALGGLIALFRHVGKPADAAHPATSVAEAPPAAPPAG